MIGDLPGNVLEMIARIAGAASGRRFGKIVGSGGTVQIPGIFSKRFQELLASGVRDPATRLLTEAISDEAMFKELLKASFEAGTTDLSPIATRRLNAWVATVLAEQGGVFEEE